MNAHIEVKEFKCLLENEADEIRQTYHEVQVRVEGIDLVVSLPTVTGRIILRRASEPGCFLPRGHVGYAVAETSSIKDVRDHAANLIIVCDILEATVAKLDVVVYL